MKKKFIFFLVLTAVIPFLTESCKLTSPDDNDVVTEGGKLTITGEVIDSVSGNLLEGAVVFIETDSLDFGEPTDADGKFSIEVTINKSQEVYISVSKEGYYERFIYQRVIAGNNVELATFKLRPFFDLEEESIEPASINLFSQNYESIGVKESGSVEVAEVIFEVRDSAGVPIDLDHKVTVSFRLGNSPGGGEYLFPDTAVTNGKGQVTVAVNSGTKAGVVQVVAEINQNGSLIKSRPVFIAIHGGLPDDDHLTLTLTKYNVPALILVQDIDATIVAGDKYSNPVKPGTAVYFNTTGGTIEGSILTDDLGKGVATFTTGNPVPTHPDYGIAYGTISAKTADENEDSISTEVIFLYSGGIEIFDVAPTTFDIEDGGSQSFSYTVADRYGHPLTSGSKYTVTFEGEDVILSGATDITMGDALFGNTDFTFRVSDKTSGDNLPRTVSIKVTATHPISGTQTFEFAGTMR
ncbi:MAG: hypothetical protein A2068_09240 [Ignavibacteria bacterium GWB2_35_6b]|nr:MAG: hypothetical protein A2068_09240 [Ignavibacteria bacterium GWB2_35_6b]